MATTIPLPALQARAPEAPNPLEQFLRITQIRNMMSEGKTRDLQNQQMQENLEDTRKARAAWQASGGDPDRYLQNLAKMGADPQTIISQNSAIDEMRKRHADLDKVTLENKQALDDQIRGQITSIIQAPEESKNALWAQEKQNLAKVNPQFAASLADQYPGDQVATSAANYLALGSVLSKEATDKVNAGARVKAANTGAARLAGEQDPNSPLYKPSADYVSLQAGQGNPQAQAIQSNQVQQAGNIAGAQAKARQPYQMKLEQVRQDVSQQMATNKDARDKIETNVLKPYEEKMRSIDELQSAIQQAQTGNVTAARGVLLKLIGVTNPDGTKRYNGAEADRLLSQGGISERFKGALKNVLTGDNWTAKMASDMSDFASAQGVVASSSLNRGIANVNRLYNTQVGGGLVQGDAGGTPQATPRASNDPFSQFGGKRR